MKRLGFRLARWGFVGLPCLGLACAEIGNNQRMPTANPAAYPTSPGPAADSAFGVRLSPEPIPHEVKKCPQLPLSLDAVFRLAEQNNPQMAVATAKVAAAFAEKELADNNWIPDIYLGVGYWRHDGGIQLQEGQLIRSDTQAMLAGPQISATFNPHDRAFRQLSAARQVWQSQGDLTKITSEQLLEAASTYIDVLAAYSAMGVSRDYEKSLKELEARVNKAIAAIGKAADLEIELARIQGELTTQQFTQQKLRATLDSLSAKLAYLLGVDPTTHVLPEEKTIEAFHIVDVSQPADALVSQALTNGPGIKEIEGILWVIQDGMAKAEGPARFLPEFNFLAGEGVFGAGPNNTMNYANRFDMGVQARWNITNVFSAEHKRQVACTQMSQAQWTYHELRQKLTLGVQEARNTIVASGGLFAKSEEQIREAKKVVALNEKRLEFREKTGATYGDVMLSHKAVSMAQLGYIDLLREFDKAELRLMILLGPGAPACRMELPCSQK